MIRFIDLRHVAEDIGERFAFWNTVTDRFIADDMGDQAWETIGDFIQGYNGSYELARFVRLTPEWAKHAALEREVFKLEVDLATADSMPMARATNKDGSAQCVVPLSPLVLGALQGRKLAYFYGEQVFGVDASVGAIEGQIVINFDTEAEGQSW